jgi:hypothetical protein
MSGSIMVTKSVSSSRKPRYALASGNDSRYNFPVTIKDRSGKVRVVSGETIKPKRNKRKPRSSKNRKVSYRLSAQRVSGGAITFDEGIMRKIGTIHQES